MSTHRHDEAGRPLDPDGKPAIESLTDDELAEELTVAGMADQDDVRNDRYVALVAEKRRRVTAAG